MSAASVAAKARDPDRLSSKAPLPVAYEELAEPKQGTTVGSVEEATPKSNEGSAHGSTSTSSRQDRASPFQTSSLPPEILGLFNRAGGHSRDPSMHDSQASLQCFGPLISLAGVRLASLRQGWAGRPSRDFTFLLCRQSLKILPYSRLKSSQCCDQGMDVLARLLYVDDS